MIFAVSVAFSQSLIAPSFPFRPLTAQTRHCRSGQQDPFITALMPDLLAPEPHETVLEVGTGLGYHAASLVELVGRVCSIEIVEKFADEADSRLRQTGYNAVEVRVGNEGGRGSDT